VDCGSVPIQRLEAAQLNPKLRLVFLWRGVLANEMQEKIKRLGVEKRVEIINKQVDVNQVLANVHGSVTLAAKPGIVKSYPHSLLDSLAAGKPVLVSRAIPMADYVEKIGCGEIVEEVTVSIILSSIEAFVEQYAELQSVAQQIGQKDFSQEAMLASYQEVYEHAINQSRSKMI